MAILDDNISNISVLSLLCSLTFLGLLTWLSGTETSKDARIWLVPLNPSMFNKVLWPIIFLRIVRLSQNTSKELVTNRRLSEQKLIFDCLASSFWGIKQSCDLWSFTEVLWCVLEILKGLMSWNLWTQVRQDRGESWRISETMHCTLFPTCLQKCSDYGSFARTLRDGD